MTALSRSDAFAFLVPVSTDAAEVLKLRVNKALLEDAKFSDHLILHKSFSRGERPYVVKLDYALLFGRPCLTFGSSRCNEFQFPKAVDIGASHFVLHFEMQTGVFLLTDISPSGTFISTHPTQGLKRLHRATYPLLQTSYIHLGREQRYRFQITLAPYMRDLSAFTNLFREYAQSVDQPLPACIKDIRAIKTPLVTLDEKYINLHGVGQSKFEVVHTCIRISDGRLLAIKQSHDQVADPSQHLSRVNQQQARREIQLLRGVRHPNIVRFVDHISMSHSTFLVMEFVPIGSLADLMNTAQLKEDFMRPLVRQCLCALQHLHSRGISHRNIRPESILVRSRRPLNIRLCNFGGADRSSNTDPKRNTGEDFVGMDIWALGILTLAAFGCRPGIPPEGSGDYRIASFRNADCLPDFQHLPCAALLDGMLKVDPSSRYSAEECLKDSWLQQAAIKKRRGSLCDISDTRPAKRLKTAGDFSTREYSHDASHYPHRNEATSERATHLHPREEIDSFDADSRTSWPVRVWSTIFGRSHI